MNIIKSNKIVKIAIFEKKYITKNFIDSLNDRLINRFMEVRKVKQNKKSAVEFYESFKKSRDHYLAILNDNNLLIGTITMRKVSEQKFNKYWSDKKLKWNKETMYLGFMILNTKLFGTQQSKDCFQMALKYGFTKLKAKVILAGTDIRNAASNFNLVRNGFKMYKKTSKEFFFKLEK